MAVFNGLPFVLRAIIMDPSFITCNDLQEVLAFFFFLNIPGVPEKCELFQLSFHQAACVVPIWHKLFGIQEHQ